MVEQKDDRAMRTFIINKALIVSDMALFLFSALLAFWGRV